MDRHIRFSLANLAAALGVVLLAQCWWSESRRVEPVPYSQFEQALTDSRVSDVAITGMDVLGRGLVRLTALTAALVPESADGGRKA